MKRILLKISRARTRDKVTQLANLGAIIDGIIERHGLLVDLVDSVDLVDRGLCA